MADEAKQIYRVDVAGPSAIAFGGEIFRPGKILTVMPKLRADVGSIAKSETANTGQFTFQYRSIETVLKVVAPLLDKHGITTAVDILPDGHQLQRFERKTKSGVSTNVHAKVSLRMYWIASEDGSYVTSCGAGEGMDGVADFASDKAMSYAIKQAIVYGLMSPATKMPDPHGDDSAAPTYDYDHPVSLAKRMLADANSADDVTKLGNRFAANAKGTFNDEEKALLVMMAEMKLDKLTGK